MENNSRKLSQFEKMAMGIQDENDRNPNMNDQITNEQIDNVFSDDPSKYITNEQIDKMVEDDPSILCSENPFDIIIKNENNIKETNIKKGVGDQTSEPMKPKNPEDNSNKTSTPNSYVVTADQLINNEITEIPMLIDPLIPKVGLATIAGSSDTGKSSILRQLALNIVGENSDFLGYEIKSEHNSVIYVSTEDDEYALSALLKKQNPEKLPDENLRNLRFILTTENLLGKIEDELKRKPADCVIIDAFSDVYTGDINTSNIIRTYLNKYSELGKEYETAVIFLHHTNKKAESLTPSKNNLLGSQGFESKMRVVIELRGDLQVPEYRHLCIVKGNYIPAELKNKSIKLEFNKNLLFTNVGEGVDFLDLAKNEERQLEEKEDAKKRAIVLKKEGKSYTEITKILAKEGQEYARSTIGNWLRESD